MKTLNLLAIACVMALTAMAQPVVTPGLPPDANFLPNDGTTGTTQGCWIGLTSSGNAIKLPTSAASGNIGFAISGAGTTNQVAYVTRGVWPATLDNTGTAGHYVVPSTSAACQGSDTGSTSRPSTGLILGIVQGAAAGGKYYVVLSAPDTVAVTGTGSGTVNSGTSGTMAYYASTGTAVSSGGAHQLSVVRTCAAASGSGTAYTCTTAPSFTPAANDSILFVADTANTGSATLNVNSSSAATIKKQGGGTNLAANDMLSGQRVSLVYDGTNWQMGGQVGNAPAGSGTVNSGTSGQLAGYASSGTAVSGVGAHQVAAVLTCVSASASGTAYTCSTSPSFSPAAGDAVLFKADVANTASATLNVNAAGAATIKKQGGGTNLAANDLLVAQYVPMLYDGTNWQMQGQTGNASSGGLTKLWYAGTSAATISGTSQTRFFPPFGNGNATSVSPGVSPMPVTGTVGDVHLCFTAAIPATDSIVATLEYGTGAWTEPGGGTMTDSGTVVATITTSTVPSTGGSAGTAGCYAIGSTQSVTGAVPITLKVTSSTGTTGNVSWYSSITP